ncbi:MAG: hypothetical protein NTY48_05245 [Candidatus Diapherotrites archaeon]|nr:hypothetical protein [Candidatus Diapherotrites archaeon]
MRPLFRKPVNRKLTAYASAKKANTSYRAGGDTGQQVVFFDVLGSQKEVKAEKSLERAMKNRKTGLKGFARRILSPTQMRRVKNIQRIRELREQGRYIEKPQTNMPYLKRKGNLLILHGYHPLVDGFAIGSRIKVTSIRGNEREGTIISADKSHIKLDTVDGTETLRLGKIRRIDLLN